MRAASKEIDKVLHYAPEFPDAHFERGRVLQDGANLDAARRSFAKAAELTDDPVNAAAYEAWAARAARRAHAGGDAKAQAHAESVLRRRPDYAQHQLLSARAEQRGDRDAASEMVELGLAVAPRSLELLQLRGELDDAEY